MRRKPNLDSMIKNNKSHPRARRRKKKKRGLIRKSDFWLLPNILTLSRVVSIPFIGICLYYNLNLLSLIVFALSGVSDYIDGWVARRYNDESKLGMLLDPLADKLIILCVMILLLWKGRLEIEIMGWSHPLLPPLLVIVTVGREIAITGLRSIASTAGIVIAASSGGKLKTWLQFVAISLIIYGKSPLLELGHILLIISVLTALISAVQYTVRFMRGLPQ